MRGLVLPLFLLSPDYSPEFHFLVKSSLLKLDLWFYNIISSEWQITKPRIHLVSPSFAKKNHYSISVLDFNIMSDTLGDLKEHGVWYPSVVVCDTMSVPC